MTPYGCWAWCVVAIVFLVPLCVVPVVDVIVGDSAHAWERKYMQFVDTRALHVCGSYTRVPNCLNVVSNAPFCGIALWVAVVGGSPSLAAGALATGIGSSVFHWHPRRFGLLLDRCGMMLLMSAIIAQGDHLLWLLWGFLAAATLFMWYHYDDVAFYAALTKVLAPLAIYMFHPRAVPILTLYLIALLLEAMDADVFNMSGHAVSGHTLKHLAAAAAVVAVVV